MSLQLVPTEEMQQAVAPLDGAHLVGAHLDDIQMAELLAEPAGAAQAHLLDCEECAAELGNLRESLALFRATTNTYAAQELRASCERIEQVVAKRSAYRAWLAPAYWATAAALLIAATIPLQVQRHHALGAAQTVTATSAARTAPPLSDAALLDDVDQELALSVPAPMQALADPTGDAQTTDVETSNTTSTQGKD